MNSTNSNSKLETSGDTYEVHVVFPPGLQIPKQVKKGFLNRDAAVTWRNWLENQLTERYNCSRARLLQKGFQLELKSTPGVSNSRRTQ